MAGVLYKSGEYMGVEATGVYEGVLKEDMIDTVRRVKKPFIDVFIDKVFFEDADYPLTYVPVFNMVLPLKEGQKVWVYFFQENHRYPVLWKLADDFGDESDYAVNYTVPSGFGSTEDTTEVMKLSDDMWFIGTEHYGVLHWGEQCVILDGNDIYLHARGNITIEAGGKIKIIGQTVDVNPSGG